MAKFKIGDIIICDYTTTPKPVCIASVSTLTQKYLVSGMTISFIDDVAWRLCTAEEILWYREIEIKKEIGRIKNDNSTKKF